eukprot:363744-Chlamydomonas_euryale.AAC.2
MEGAKATAALSIAAGRHGLAMGAALAVAEKHLRWPVFIPEAQASHGGPASAGVSARGRKTKSCSRNLQ